MRFVCMAGWIFAAAWSALGYQTPQAATNSAPATAILEGQVFNGATGAPLKKATVSLNGLGARPAGGMPARFTKETDDQGRFSFTALEAGRYQLSVTRSGFLRQSYGARKYSSNGTPIALAPDQHVKDIVFKLSPQSVITGKVLDEDGDPVAGVQVRALKFQYQGGKKTWTQVAGGQTSDIGEFRIPGLDPGRYLVATSSRNQSNPMQTATAEPLPKMAEMAYAATYYPSTMDSSNAVPVDVGAGGETRGIDIRLRKAPVFRIRGKVANVPGGRVMVMITPKEGVPSAPAMSQAAPPEYRFEIRNVSPGSYVLHAQMGNGNQQAVAFQEVQVGTQHIDGVVLAVAGGNDIPGTVKVEDATAAVPMPNLSVFLLPAIPIGAPARAKAADDLKFTLKNVPPLHYKVSVSGVPDTCFVKSIRYGGQPVPDEGVDFLGSGALEVILSATAAEVDGAVVDKDGKPVAGAIVALISKGSATDIQSRSTDENGAAMFKGLKPGEYKLIAWEDIPRGAYQDPEFVKPYEGRGETVKLDASARQAIQLKVIPAEETDK
jgi:uncharacterized GH25 family protein